MNRFDWLELPTENQKTAAVTQTGEPPLYDEQHYLQCADRAWKNGNFESALRYYAKTLGQNPDREEAWLGQVRCLIDLDELREARLWVSKALDRMPRSAPLLCAKTIVLSKMLEDDKALEASGQALSQKHQDWYGWFSRGFVLVKKGDKNADYCFKKALEFNPEDGFIHLRIGMAYLEAGNFHQALPYLKKAIQSDPQNPLALFKYGFCCEKLGWADQAKLHYRRALILGGELKPEIEWALGSAGKSGLFAWIKGVWNHQRLNQEA